MLSPEVQKDAVAKAGFTPIKAGPLGGRPATSRSRTPAAEDARSLKLTSRSTYLQGAVPPVPVPDLRFRRRPRRVCSSSSSSGRAAGRSSRRSALFPFLFGDGLGARRDAAELRDLPDAVRLVRRHARRARAGHAAGGRHRGLPLRGREPARARGRASRGRAARRHPVGRLRLLRPARAAGRSSRRRRARWASASSAGGSSSRS